MPDLKSPGGTASDTGAVSPQALDRVAGKVELLHRQLVPEMRQAPSVFADEASWWVGEPGWWLWTFTNPETTLFRVEDSRSSAVVLKTLGQEFAGLLVLPFINTVTFADGACEARSRREEESMQGHRRRRETKRSPATPIRPKGWGGTGPSSCCFSSPMSLHRLVVAPRSGLRRAPNKRHRIYESEY